MSNITAIYHALANMEVGTAKLKAKDVHEIKFQFSDKELPMRLLMPSTETDAGFIMIGSLVDVAWQITDMMLLDPVGTGGGIHEYSGAMVEYIGDYLTAIKANRSLYAGSHVENIAAEAGMIDWGSKQYYGVIVTLTVKEKM